MILSDEYFMKMALKEAEVAFSKGEVPVGAVVVSNNRVIARAHNMSETLSDPTAHAEMQAITAATAFLGSKYMAGCSLYVTLEPCIMCAGALYWSQTSRLIYGTDDEKRGFSTVDHRIIHPGCEISHGVMRDECSEILKNFFSEKRINK